jgi:hypothetical protein
MATPKKPRKRKSPSRKKAISVPFVRELLDDLDKVDRSLTIAKRCCADDKEDFRERIEALVEVVAQQGMVLKDLLLALEEDSDP